MYVLQNFFTPISILMPQGDSQSQSSPIWIVMYSKAPSDQSAKFSPIPITRGW